MSGRLITVLYEDQQAKGERTYGPHILLLACVADTEGGDPYSLQRRIKGIARKGDGNLKSTLARDGSDLASAGALIAMFDHDKVRACYALPPTACKSELLGKIRADATGSPTIIFLERNMEDLTDACCAALNRPRPATKPKPSERDGILQAAAAGHREVRAAILAAMPSFKRLVEAVRRHVTTG